MANRKNVLSAVFLFTFGLLNVSSSLAQSGSVMNSSELKLALDKLNVLGSVLYVAAHPDDENNGLLAYFAKGKLLRTGYLSLTRGDGGQNLIGPEQGALLGVIRTQELLSARKIDGAKQFFSRAVDFGFSKSAKETFQFWGKEKILSDVVWVIREFRPDVIITRFHGTKEDGHGNHIASEILAAEAFKLAGNPKAFPEQLKYVKPWQPKRIFWNAWLPLLERDHADLSKFIKVDVGVYNPLLGKSYPEIAALSRSMHKTQGFGSSPRYGDQVNYFSLTDGSPAHSLFEGIDMTWNRVAGGEKVGRLLKQADEKFNPEHPEETIPILLKAYKELSELKDGFWTEIKKKDLVNVIRSCAGMLVQSNASDYSAVPGQKISVTSEIINRSNYSFVLKKVETTDQVSESSVDKKLEKENLVRISSEVRIPDNAAYSQPYWLVNKEEPGDYVVNDQRLIGKPENDPPLETTFTLSAGNQDFEFKIPVNYIWNDPVAGEKTRPFIIVPPVAINIESKNYVFPSDSARKIEINLTANSNDVSGVLKLNIPDGWTAKPSQQNFSIPQKHDVIPVSFLIYPPASSSDVELTAQAEVGDKIVKRGMITISYPHIKTQTVFPPAETKLLRLNIKKVIDNIGYIMGPGDDIPQCLEELGYKVTLLSNKEIENGNLSKYDAIITGVRVYNTNPAMVYEQPKLLQYVKNGGTLVVQYNKNFGLVTDKIGPYTFHISGKRVTDETSKVDILDPHSPLMNYPNKISEKDFDGWIQERGIYFPDEWDAHYKTVIACHDPGENDLPGGLIYTKYGKGTFVYTGYDWFRELPAGVPGAYRIFVNLISAGKSPGMIN